MGLSRYPSKLTLPRTNHGVTSVLEYLVNKFPGIAPEVWRQRMADGKVHWHDGGLISADTPYKPQQRVYYYREVKSEKVIPFEEKIIFQDENILVAYKPHFLAVIPGGAYVNECLQNRLRLRTGIEDLQALHRLDRVTAGLVLFSVNPATRHLYHALFAKRQIHKTYHAIAKVNAEENLCGEEWDIENLLIKSAPKFLMQVVDGKPNSHSLIRCLAHVHDKALFELEPITGKTHQLRVHMQTLGWPILNDKYYPELQPKTADVYSKPLQLLAKALQFFDPVAQLQRSFSSDVDLVL